MRQIVADQVTREKKITMEKPGEKVLSSKLSATNESPNNCSTVPLQLISRHSGVTHVFVDDFLHCGSEQILFIKSDREAGVSTVLLLDFAEVAMVSLRKQGAQEAFLKHLRQFEYFVFVSSIVSN